MGDNTDRAGMHWTKCTNIGIDLVSTLVAEQNGLVSEAAAKEHIAEVLAILARLRAYHGIFPEIVQIDDGIRAEVKDGKIRYSSIDSAWVTMALSLVEARYRSSDALLAKAASDLVARQDYSIFVGDSGLLGAGFFVDATTGQNVGDFGFAYGDRNSEVRPLVLGLVGLGKLPASAWDNMRYAWVVKEGLPLASGWHWSAFVEMSGELWLDEMSLAPGSLGKSHANYIEATLRVARRRGDAVWGFAPACDGEQGYTEYGLDRPDLVSPYAAALLAVTGDARAVSNLARVMAALPGDGRPAPDGLHPRTGAIACSVARTLDQGLLFLALNADVVRALAAQTTWFASAEQRIRQLDEAPPLAPSKAPSGPIFGALDNARGLDAASGGATFVEQARSNLRSAAAVRAWADFMPDFSASLQHPLETLVSVPDWRVDLQARASLSLDKFWTAVAAGDAKEVARGGVRRAERNAVARGLEAYLALYSSERRLAELKEHRASLAGFAPGLAEGIRLGSVNDMVLLTARLSALDEDIAAAEGARKLAIARLRTMTGAAVEETGLDPALDLAAVLELIEPIAVGTAAAEEDEKKAGVEREISLLHQVESRAPYVPELRVGAVVAIPRESEVDGANRVTGHRWITDQVTGEFTLAFRWQPGQAQAREAQAAAVESSQWSLEELRRAHRESAVQARARLEASVAAWSADGRHALAEALYRDTGARLLRAEVNVTALTSASRALVDAAAIRERFSSRPSMHRCSSPARTLEPRKRESPPARRAWAKPSSRRPKWRRFSIGPSSARRACGGPIAKPTGLGPRPRGWSAMAFA